MAAPRPKRQIDRVLLKFGAKDGKNSLVFVGIKQLISDLFQLIKSKSACGVG